MSTSRALRIFRYFVHPGLSLIPLFRSYRSRGKRFPLGPCQLRLRRLIAVSVSSSPAFLPTSRYQWDATPPDLGPANDMVRRIPYSRLTSLFFNERTFHRRQNSSRRRGTFGKESGPGPSDGAGSASDPKRSVAHALSPRHGNKHDRGGLFVPVGRHRSVEASAGGNTMARIHLAGITTAIIASALTATAQAQQPPAPPFATTKVTDSVYIFRYGNHQSMFIVTPAGVIATDPISERRPAKPYIDAIQAVTKAPVKYVIYSHSHFDHIAGGKPFKDLGATFVAHANAKARIAALKPDDVVIPDQVVDGKRNVTLGGTTLELNYIGKNHSDSTLVMRLPREKIIFTVDWIPIPGIQFRGMADTYVPDIEEGLKKVIAMDWETLIPGHPGPGMKQTGTKDNAREELAYLQDLSAAVKKAVSEGKTYADAQKDIKLPKYESWPNYNAFLPANIERYYDYWNRGI